MYLMSFFLGGRPLLFHKACGGGNEEAQPGMWKACVFFINIFFHFK